MTTLNLVMGWRRTVPERGQYDADATLIRQLKEGDERAMEGILERYQQTVSTFCLSYVGDLDVVEDLCQDTFVSLWRERMRYRHENKLKAYLLTTARFRCLAYLKKKKKLLGGYDDRRVAPESLEQGTMAKQLLKAIQELDAPFAEVLVLRYLQQRELSEIAEITGAPLGTVKSRLHRAVREIREVFDERR